jgi:hypothetical protein
MVTERLRRVGCAGVVLPDAVPRAAEGAAWGVLRAARAELDAAAEGPQGAGGGWGRGGEGRRELDKLAGADDAALAREMGA